MRILVTLLIFLALVWGGGWLVGARVVERSTETWLAEQAAAGRLAAFDALSVGGFPGRLTLDIERLRLGDPRLASGWEVPGLTVGLEARRPGTVRAALDGRQRLVLAGEVLELEARTLEAAVRVGGTALALQGATADVVALALRSQAGWGAELGRLALIGAAEAGAPERMRLDVSMETLAVEGVVHPRLRGIELPAVDRLDLAALLELDAPLDRHARARRPQPVALEVLSGTLDWGATRVQAAGRLEIGADGVPEGRIDLEIGGWRALLELAVAARAVEPDLAPTLERVLGALETAGGRPGVLPLPLVFQRGRVSLGPVPLGRAPVLRL